MLPLLLLLVLVFPMYGADVDKDGLDDELEQVLLQKFAPIFYVSQDDCDVAPASFVRDSVEPKVLAKDGTIYGQVLRSGESLEIHYYHLWSKDCGRRMSHDLDAETVSVLLRAEGKEWKAQNWYAAAHENTLCDMSHAIKAARPDGGHPVWISKDKHASFFSQELCARGCGNDDCSNTARLQIRQIVNIGERNSPMNGAVWTASSRWPLADKMQPDFVGASLARMPQGDDVELLPAREPAVGVRTTIKVAGTTFGALETANIQTTDAVAMGVGTAVSSTGKALKKSFEKSVRWIKKR